MSNQLKVYYWILLSLRINVTYFLICWIAVVVAIFVGLDGQITGASLPGRGLSLWASFQIFLTIVLYPIPVTVLILFLLDKIAWDEKSKKSVFIGINIIWNILVISDLSGPVNVLDDHKGVHSIHLFIFIVSILIIVAHVFWTSIEKHSFNNKISDDQDVGFKKSVIVFCFVYYFAVIISTVFCFFKGSVCFDGFIFDEMLMSHNSTLTLIIIGYGLCLFLIRQLKIKFLVIILIPTVYLSNAYFVSPNGYNPLTTYQMFRELLVHYNPLWLSKEERGHDTINP